MIFKKRDELNIVKTDDKLEWVSFKEALNYITVCDTFVYFEYDGKVYGSINFKSVNQYDENYIFKINEFYYLENKNFFKAADYLLDSDLYEVPVVINGILVGACVSGIEYSAIKVFFSEITYNNMYSGKHILFYHSTGNDDIGLFIKEFFNKCDSSLDILTDIRKLGSIKDSYDYILVDSFNDYESLLKFLVIFSVPIDWLKFRSLYDIYKDCNASLELEYYKKFASDFFSTLKLNGVNVFRLGFGWNDELLNKNKELIEKYTSKGMTSGDSVVNPDLFYGDYYSSEYFDFFKNISFTIKPCNGYNVLKDFNSIYCNVVDGRRVTVGNPVDYEKTIYFFGPCFIIGKYADDKNTIESLLSLKLNGLGYKVRVINSGSFNSVFSQLKLIDSFDIKSGDIVIVFDDPTVSVDNVDIIDLTDIFIKADANWFTDWFLHCNQIVNGMVADKIYKSINGYLDIPVGDVIVKQDYDFAINYYLNKYFDSFDSSKYDRIGSIVMNANPFTNGHLYLVNEALKYVDYLVVFVLSEDKSAFPFTSRYSMVKNGLMNYSNVLVVPSGDLIISNNTFPEYFLKIVDEDVESNMRKDVEIFSKYIAPRLNIKYRFVGTEEVDEFTLKYNEVMREVLPQNGINFVEIPRKKIDGKIISASVVREKIFNCEYDLIKDYVPETTYKYICDMVGI